ncbi:ATPase [Ktedonobacteria bacterium brp13]|nr:ATPase [Ktedonobacteria bacterium brp13]
MSTSSYSHPSRNQADGTLETQASSTIVRFERSLPHSIERVWAAITEPEELVAWLAEAEIDLRLGGSVRLHWLNSDGPARQATITQCEPPRLLEYRFEPREDAQSFWGVLRWELQEEGNRCLLTLTHILPLSATHLPEKLAGWHTHLDFLAEALAGQVVDWPRWPKERWTRHHEHYCHEQLSSGNTR